MNRLETANENGGASWTQNFSYDRFGNRKLEAGTTLPAPLNASNNPVINPTTNRIDSDVSGQSNYSYDGAGNLTHDATGHGFAYDAENKQATFDGGASTSGGATYFHDGDGHRVKKIVGGPTTVTTVFVYNIEGQLVAEYSNASPPGLGGTSYLTADTLGSLRVITGPNQEVKARHDYLPFGEEIGGPHIALIGGRTTTQGYTADAIRQKFTQKERDIETGLDYFGARYLSSIQGRFTSIDPLLASAEPTMPQSWNRYTYVLNNPLAYIDPTGEIWVRSGSGDVIWFSQERWDEEISKLKDSKGNAAYTPLTPSEMEFNTNFGRVRQIPMALTQMLRQTRTHILDSRS